MGTNLSRYGIQLSRICANRAVKNIPAKKPRGCIICTDVIYTGAYCYECYLIQIESQKRNVYN
jgi:hypothetical protein